MGQVSWKVPLDVQVEGWDALKKDIKGREPSRRWGWILKKPLEQKKKKKRT